MGQHTHLYATHTWKLLRTAKAFAAGGASATEQAAGVLQLGQALGSGFLQGDELRSLRENAPLVAKAIADAMGVSIGELKNLGAEGKLTSEVVFRALLNAEDSINSAFAVTVPRASDAAVLAFDNLKLKVGEYLQETGLVSKSSNMLADVLDFVSGNVGMFADALVVASAALTGALGAQAVLSVVNGLNTIAAGAATTSKALALIRVASAFMFGPAGLIIGVGAAAAALAYLAIRGNDAQRAIKRLDEAQRGANDALRATSQYVDDDVIGKIGESAGQSVEPVSNLAGALKKVADALQDATIAQFLEDAKKLQASITETQAAIADAEAKRARLQRQAVINSSLNTQMMVAAGKATVSVNTPELDQEIGLARATLAGLERRQGRCQAHRGGASQRGRWQLAQSEGGCRSRNPSPAGHAFRSCLERSGSRNHCHGFLAGRSAERTKGCARHYSRKPLDEPSSGGRNRNGDHEQARSRAG